MDQLSFPPAFEQEPRASFALDVLNPPQKDAARTLEGPLLVFAGAGSGKTRVITYRIANLLVNAVPPYRILAVTFTNKAAGEMRRRVDGLVGDELARDLWVGTFHAVCARLLRRYAERAKLSKHFLIYDDGDQRAVMNRAFKELSIDDKRFSPRKVLGAISRQKQECMRAADFTPGSYFDDIVAKLWESYERQLGAANALDFDDLLVRAVLLAEDEEAGEDLRRRFHYVLVDEFQDVNHAQYRLIRALTRAKRNLCVVGDDDQSIYRWRGADVRIVRGFRHDYQGAKVIKLEQNYRSTGNIVSAALGVIKVSSEREPKELWTANEAGDPILVGALGTEREEAAWVAEQVQAALSDGTTADELAVFYRVHAQSRVLEEVFRAQRIPYQVVGGMRFFERAEVKDTLSYLRVLRNPSSDVDLLRIINVPSRKIGSTTMDRVAEVANEHGVPLLEGVDLAVQKGAVGAAAKKALTRFMALFRKLSKVAETAAPSEAAEAVLEESGYMAMLRADDSPESEARQQNLAELVGSILEFEEEMAAAGETATLDDYLTRVSLAASIDEMDDQPKVALMTVHAAKGLEFERVFITGMEEDLFPFRSSDAAQERDEEEERRLAYVAITRARRYLAITHCQRRQIFGTTRYGLPSRFLKQLPPETAQGVVLGTAGGGAFVDRPAAASRSGPFVHPMDRGAAPPVRPIPSRMSGHRTPPRAPGERYVEPVEDGGGYDTDPRAFVGRAVTHPKFGEGTIKAVDGGPDPTASVAFVGWGIKKVKIRFLELA